MSAWSTVRVKRCAYLVPSRLMHHGVIVRLFEERIEVWVEGKLELACERLRGENRSRVDYCHIGWTLTRKPGSFARYVYREQMFPSVTLRKAYDALQANDPGIKGDTEYLRVLHLASRATRVVFTCGLGASRRKPSSRARHAERMRLEK